MPEPTSLVTRFVNVSASIEVKAKPGEPVENYLALSPKQLVSSVFDLPSEEMTAIEFHLVSFRISIDDPPSTPF